MKTTSSSAGPRLAGLGCILLTLASPLLAQTESSPSNRTSPDSEAVQMEEFVTTGSRLSRAAVENTIPTITISMDKVLQSGAMDVQTYLRDQSIVIGPGNINSNVFQNNFGGTSIGLRGLNTRNTLALINGRRMTQYGIDQLYDLSLIPSAAIKRTEVLKSGASSIYGTDAVAGVINFILNDNYRGGTATVRYGTPTQSGGGQHQEYSFNYGIGQGSLSIMIGGSFEKQTEILQPERPWSLGPAGYSTSTNPGRFVFSGNPALPNGVYTLKSGVSIARSPADFKIFDASTEVPQGDLFNFGLFEPIVKGFEKTAFFANWVGDIGVAGVEWFGDFQFQKSSMPQARAPILQLVGSTQPNLWIPADNYWNRQIFGASAVDIRDWRYRFTEFGKSAEFPESYTTRVATGIRGKVQDKYAWEMGAVYSSFYMNSTFPKTVNLTKLEELVKKTTPDAFNPFTRSYLDPTGPHNPPEVINSLISKSENIYTSRLVSYDAKISGPVATLRTGDIEAAAGLEMRMTEGKIERDQVQLNAGATQYGLRTTVYAGFGELSVPVTSKIRLGGAVRHEKFEHRFDTTVSSFTGRYEPMPGLIFRASYSEGFVPPSITNLAAPQSNNVTGTVNITDPRPNAPSRAYDVPSMTIRPQNLQPEETEVINVGVAYSSRRLKGFSAIVDYYTIDQTNLISTGGYQFMINQNVAGGGPSNPNAPYADQLVFDSLQNIWVLVRQSASNFAALRTDGIDVELEQVFETADLGRFTLSLTGTRLLSFERQNIPTVPPANLLGLAEGYTTFPKLKGTFSLAWQKGNWNVFSSVVYNDALEGILGAPAGTRGYDDSFILNLSVDYRLPWDMTARVGVNNVFDTDPPTNPAAQDNNYPGQGYDPRGRFVHVRLTKKF